MIIKTTARRWTTDKSIYHQDITKTNISEGLGIPVVFTSQRLVSVFYEQGGRANT